MATLGKQIRSRQEACHADSAELWPLATPQTQLGPSRAGKQQGCQVGMGRRGAERGPEWSGVEEQVAKNLSQESGQEVGCM